MTEILCEAIIFDFDGTLADSMPFLEMIGVEIMMKYYGVSKDDATQRYRISTGLPFEHQIEINFPDDNRNEHSVEEFEDLKIKRIFEQLLFPDTEKVLSQIKEMGIKIFVSSSTFQPTITEYFRRKGHLSFFEEILGYRSGFEKGAAHFRHARNAHSIDLEKTVFVGDSIMDYERSRGFCHFIALTRMFTEDDFRNAGHSGHIVSSLSEIPPLLQPFVQ